jgi:hypothetical protein
MVKNMAAAGLSQQTIQLCLPNAPKHPKTFVKNFKAELSTSGPLVTAHAVSKLVVAIGNGEAWAICFWLKCRAGFQETAAHRFVGGDGKDRTLDLASVQAYCASIPDDPA